MQPRPQEKQFIIELPDVKNKNAIMEQLGTTAQMTFYYFADVQSQRNSRPPRCRCRNRRTSPRPGMSSTPSLSPALERFHTGETFRDGAQIKADWAALLAAAKANPPGAAPRPIRRRRQIPRSSVLRQAMTS